MVVEPLTAVIVSIEPRLTSKIEEFRIWIGEEENAAAPRRTNFRLAHTGGKGSEGDGGRRCFPGTEVGGDACCCETAGRSYGQRSKTVGQKNFRRKLAADDELNREMLVIIKEEELCASQSSSSRGFIIRLTTLYKYRAGVMRNYQNFSSSRS
ncbi:unnamed protein product [Cuscuta campestris]|uniref:Uncharacterized protein n=1 Tax=Cuscuta campestris TaxID=132261 RepID=A0A484N3D7_9ASTE|nr:unnamed protein product [Cuscuta campestris]